MKTGSIVALIFTMTFVMVSTLQIYIPISPQLAQIFAVSDNVMKLTFLIELLLAAIVGIPAGYLSDRFGRRPCLIFGLIIHAAGSLLCMMSPSISVFFCGRILQALGVGSLVVVGNACLSDLFQGVALARIMGLYAMMFPFTFAIAPLLGAQIYTYLGWRAVFGALLTALTFVALFIVFRLPETCHTRKKDAVIPSLIKMASSKTTFLLALTHAVPISIGATFNVNATFLYHNLFQFSPRSFSMVAAIPVMAQLTGALIYRRVVQKTGLQRALALGSRLAGAYAIICILMILRLFEGPWVTVIAVSFFALGNTFLVASAATLLLNLSKDSKGLTVSFLNLIKNLSVASIVTCASILPHQSVTPIFSAMLVISFSILLLVAHVQKALKENEVQSV